MKTAVCAQDAAIIRELLHDVDQATTEVGERIRRIAVDLSVLAPENSTRESALRDLGLRLQGDAARLLAMGRTRASVVPTPPEATINAPDGITVAEGEPIVLPAGTYTRAELEQALGALLGVPASIVVKVGGEEVDRLPVPAGPVAGDPRPGVPVMSHESLGLRKPKEE